MATLTEEAGTQAQFVYPCDFVLSEPCFNYFVLVQIFSFCPCGKEELFHQTYLFKQRGWAHL